MVLRTPRHPADLAEYPVVRKLFGPGGIDSVLRPFGPCRRRDECGCNDAQQQLDLAHNHLLPWLGFSFTARAVWIQMRATRIFRCYIGTPLQVPEGVKKSQGD